MSQSKLKITKVKKEVVCEYDKIRWDKYWDEVCEVS